MPRHVAGYKILKDWTNNGGQTLGQTDGHTDNQCDTIIPCYYHATGYNKKNYLMSSAEIFIQHTMH